VAEETGTESEGFDIDRVKNLVELMKANDLSEIYLKHGEQRIRLRRGELNPPVIVGGAPAAAPAMAPMPSAVAPVAAAPAAAPAEAAKPADDANASYVKSPMVGTFYSKPNPDAKPYIKVGDVVSADTVVCQIEAMKMFSEIPAGVSGTVTEVLVKNEEAVDVGKPLFKVAT